MRILIAVFFVFLMVMLTPTYGIENTRQSVSGSDSQVIRTDDGNVNIQKNYYRNISFEQLREVSDELAVTKSALKSFFKILEQKQVPLEDLDSTLRKIAEDYKKLKEKLESSHSDDPVSEELRRKAKETLEAGEFDRTEGFLNQAREHNIKVAGRLKEMADIFLSAAENGNSADAQLKYRIYERLKETADKYLLSAAESAAMNSCLAAIQLKYNLKYYQDALVIYRKIGDRHGEAEALYNIGLIYSKKGDSGNALKYYQDALAICREIGDRHGEAGVLYNIGLIYSEKGDSDNSLKYQQAALEICRKIGYRHGEAEVLHNIGLIYSEKDDSDNALKYYQDALAICREIGYRHSEAEVLYNIGLTYSEKDDSDNALKYYQDTLAICREIGERHGEAGILYNIGLIYSEKGDSDNSLKYQQAALEICRKIGYRYAEAEVLYNIGLIYSEKGDSDNALKYHQAALAISDSKQRTTAEGAAAGAALGAIIGQLTGVDTESTIAGALIGAGIGSIGSTAYGHHVANKKEQYANQEEYLNACIASTMQINEKTRRYNTALKNEIAKLDEDVNRMIVQYNRKKVTRTALIRKKQKVSAKLSQSQRYLNRAKDEVIIQKEVLKRESGKSQAELAKLNIEIKKLERTVSELEVQIQNLTGVAVLLSQ